MLSQIIAMGEDQNKTKNQGQIIIYVSPKHIAPRFFFWGGELTYSFRPSFLQVERAKGLLKYLAPRVYTISLAYI